MRTKTIWIHLAVTFLSIFLTQKPQAALVAGMAGGSPKECARVFFDDRLEFTSLNRLRLMTYNLEHFGLPAKNADEALRIKKIATILKDEAPDVVILQEVEGLDTLPLFAKEHLGSEYTVHQTPGNEANGIAFLVKSNLKLAINLESHKERTWNDSVTGKVTNVFTRDVPALIVRRPNSSKILMVILGNHGKSQRDRNGDPESKALRTAQVREISKIANEYKARFGSETPVIVAGDFNTDVVKGAAKGGDLASLSRGFKNSFDLLPVPVTVNERVTHTYHPQQGARELTEMDAVWIDLRNAELVENVYVYRYKDDHGQTKRLPETSEEREKNPSDHFPVVIDISTKLLSR